MLAGYGGSPAYVTQTNLAGTVNCLDVINHYTPERVAASELLKGPARLAFLAARLRLI